MKFSRVFYALSLLSLITFGGHQNTSAHEPLGPSTQDTKISEKEMELLKTYLSSLEERISALEKRQKLEAQTVGTIPFGDVVTNLHGERVGRYIRISIVIVPQEGQEKDVQNSLSQQKPVLKSWLLTHLADQTIDMASGSKNIDRLRSEIAAEFDRKLSPKGKKGAVKEVLFTEYVIQ